MYSFVWSWRQAFEWHHGRVNPGKQTLIYGRMEHAYFPKRLAATVEASQMLLSVIVTSDLGVVYMGVCGV